MSFRFCAGTILYFLSAAVAFAQSSADKNSIQFPDFYDIIDARNYCDNTQLDRIEGIWLYPEDNVTVLIKKDDFNSEKYQIISIDAKSSHYKLGEVIGYINSTTDPLKFKMDLFTKRKNKILSNPHKCAVILSNDDYALRVQTAAYKFTFNPLFFLSKFWRIVRINYNNPQSELPIGMKKIYPSYDLNGSSRFNPRYL